MCGIFCSLSRAEHVIPNASTRRLLQNRGPDAIGEYQTLIETTDPRQVTASTEIYATFLSTVLSLRGSTVVEQPLRNSATGSSLCWNGEAWSIRGRNVKGNDSALLFTKLLEASSVSLENPRAAVIELLSSVRGPYAFVFYDASNKLIYFGRDPLGRRSLLCKRTQDGSLVLSSICDNATGDTWTEVEADGVYVVDLNAMDLVQPTIVPTHIPHRRSGQDQIADLSFVRTRHVREAVRKNNLTSQCDHAQVAILFSGGLDCTILARMCHELLPEGESIDLLNVAFENPRVHGKLAPGTSPYEHCPDRITARSSCAALIDVCPGRKWRLIEVDVPYTETQAHRMTVMTLMYPHHTEMDLSISLALYFASRGVGVTRDAQCNTTESFPTPAHVLLSGLGADELFGGYQRHATAFNRQGYAGLIDELELDFNRLGKRNLGRDDRIISNAGKEVRFPYLDEDFIALALQLPVTAKCDFANAQDVDSDDPQKCLEPGKRALRLLAWQLGMKTVAAEKKRAIQFGARTAKMETGKTKGTHVLT